MSRHFITRMMPTKAKGIERWIFDIETWGLDARSSSMALGVALSWDGKETVVFKDSANARTFFESRNKDIIVYAHNGWGYDYLALGYSKREILDAEIVRSGTKILQGSFKHGDNTIHYRDSYGIINLPLSKIGQSLGYPKGETPEDFRKGRKRELTPEDVDYCILDCEILRRMLVLFEEQYNIWAGMPPGTYQLPLTIGSLSYRLWCVLYWPDHWISKQPRRSRAKGKEGQVLTDSDGEPKRSVTYRGYCDFDINELCGQGVAGGRVEVLGEPARIYENAISFDGNAWYPTHQKMPMPDIMKMSRCAPLIENIHSILNNPDRFIISDLVLEAGPDARLFLPQRDNEGRRVYDREIFDGVIYEPELKHALDNGWFIREIRDVVSGAVIRPFDQWVDFWFEQRREYQKLNDPREALIKLIMNANWGRFGMRYMHETITNQEEVYDILDGDEDWMDKYELHFFDPAGEMPYLESLDATIRPLSTWYGFAGAITSYSRVSLDKVIQAAEPYQTYCDTDSCHMTVEAYEQFINAVDIGPGLGQWGLETADEEGNLKPFPFAKYWEKKCYVFYDEDLVPIKVKHKGVKVLDSDGNLKPEAGDLTKEQSSPSIVKLYESLRRGLEMGSPIERTKRAKRWYVGEQS